MFNFGKQHEEGAAALGRRLEVKFLSSRQDFLNKEFKMNKQSLEYSKTANATFGSFATNYGCYPSLEYLDRLKDNSRIPIQGVKKLDGLLKKILLDCSSIEEQIEKNERVRKMFKNYYLLEISKLKIDGVKSEDLNLVKSLTSNYLITLLRNLE